MGLYEPGTDDPGRPELVQLCLEIGLTPEEIRGAGEDLVERAINRLFEFGDEHLTQSEIADRAGVPLALVRRLRRASGFADPDPHERNFNEHDVEALRTFVAGITVFGEDAALKMARVSGAAMARIADTAISTFTTGPGAEATREDPSGAALLQANLRATEILLQFSDGLTFLLFKHIRRGFRPLTNAMPADAIDTQSLAIGFADLVGSAAHAETRTLADLSAAIDAFETAAADTITARGGRVIKFIGDEVMFRSADPRTACRIALDLVDQVRDDPALPPLRAGVAYGDVLSREGDYYGPVVNLAARATKLAPVHGVLVTADAASGLARDEDFCFDALGAVEVRGFSSPVEFAAVRRR